MGKKICGLLLVLCFFCGIFAVAPGAFAMNKQERPTTFGCDAKALTVQKNDDKWIIHWKYDTRLESTQVKINLYQNGKFLRTIADNVTIGKDGRGSWSGSWDWGNRAELDPQGGRNGYQIEIVSLTDSNLRVMGDKFESKLLFNPTGGFESKSGLFNPTGG